MTTAPAATSEMDHLDQLGPQSFDGFLVRKVLVRRYSRQYPMPTHVVEFLLGTHDSDGAPSHGRAGAGC
jgi:predicted ATP-dependent Lon-type protease